jgi:hypothetical protein
MKLEGKTLMFKKSKINCKCSLGISVKQTKFLKKNPVNIIDRWNAFMEFGRRKLYNYENSNVNIIPLSKKGKSHMSHVV